MIPEIGHFALIVALMLAIIQGTLPIYGAARGNAVLMGMARPVAVGHFVFVATAFGCLAYAFITNDFSVLYVAEHSNSHLPLHFRFAAVWGGHEGSLLLWTFLLTVWTLAVTQFSKHLPQEMVARVLSVMGMISIGFLLFMLLTSNPFERLLPAAMDGRDLNPLLQDPGMVSHPPMLYMGYVGFSALAVQEGRSFFEPGRKVGSDLVSIIDDGGDPAGLPMAFDYEGLRKRRVPLLEPVRERVGPAGVGDPEADDRDRRLVLVLLEEHPLQHLRLPVAVVGSEAALRAQIPEDRVRLAERASVVEHERRDAQRRVEAA